MANVQYETWCRDCGETHFRILPEPTCPACGSKSVFNSAFIDCDCGTRVYLEENTNECEGCGQLWNRFGQKLKPCEEWEEDY